MYINNKHVARSGAYPRLFWGGADLKIRGDGGYPWKTHHFLPISKTALWSFCSIVNFVHIIFIFSRFCSDWLLGGAPHPLHTHLMSHESSSGTHLSCFIYNSWRKMHVCGSRTAHLHQVYADIEKHRPCLHSKILLYNLPCSKDLKWKHYCFHHHSLWM